MTSTLAHRAIDAVWRIESARIIAGLTGIVRDVGIAEEPAQDALAAAKHRAIDLWRRNKLLERKHQEFGRELEA